MKFKDIIYEGKLGFVCKSENGGYDVYKIGICYITRAYCIRLQNDDESKETAIAYCNSLEI